ncbi:phage N-6-adenine-methyltransferase [Escherichia coli]|nr:phage N-6-adenine-methyltransferase [Escherichia coli]
MTIKSNTPAHDKDCWQTPLWLFDALDIEFGFWLDSAASDKNALCAHWLTEADDALNSEWISHGAIWNNPPYSNIRPWVEKAAEQCIQQRQTVVMLVPEDMSVGWFSKALESVDEVRIITDGRINFIEPSTGLEKKGNSKGSMLDIGLAMPVKIRIECHMPDRRRRDLDNLQKAAFDALTKAGFWLDDAQVVDYRVVKMPVTKGGRLELTITEMGNE